MIADYPTEESDSVLNRRVLNGDRRDFSHSLREISPLNACAHTRARKPHSVYNLREIDRPRKVNDTSLYPSISLAS